LSFQNASLHKLLGDPIPWFGWMMEGTLKMDQAIKDAFLAGLAAPVFLYAAPGPYIGAAGILTAAQSFAIVGSRLSAVVGIFGDDRFAAAASDKDAGS
jgi:hypothetical protein